MPTPTIILVEPQLGENIGACARAVANFGLSELRIVNPRDGWPSESAQAMAAHGIDIINNTQIFDTLEDATTDIQRLYATTARSRDMVKPSITAREWASTLPSPYGRGKSQVLPAMGEGKLKQKQVLDTKILSFARSLRKKSTDVENIMWQLLRNRNFANHKFRRQHPIENYIVDFVCLNKKLIIELDGRQHTVQQKYDEERTKFLQKQGYNVLRIWNNEVLNNLEGVLEVIWSYLNHPHPNPLPKGEGTKTAIMFGREKSGLTNTEITLADAIIEIPVDDACPSLNIAQAVGIMCYEWFINSSQLSAVNNQQETATKKEILYFLEQLETSIDEKGFFKVEEKRERMLQNIRNIFTRTQLTEQELQILHGIVRCLRDG